MGNLELNVMVTLLFFNLFVGLGLDYMYPDKEFTAADVTDEIFGVDRDEGETFLDLGVFGSLGYGTLYAFVNLSDVIFTMIGIDIVGGLVMLPSFLSAIILFLNQLLIFSTFFYAVSRFWIG